MLDSVTSVASMASQLSSQTTGQRLEVAVLKKAHDLQQQQGQDLLKLMASAEVTAPPTTGIDVYA